MKIEKHMTVYVKSLRTHGVVLGIQRNGTIKVGIQKLTFELPESDLTVLKGPLENFEKRAKPRTKKERPQGVRGKSSSNRRSIDLHGRNVEETLKEVEAFLNRAIVDEIDELEVIHGVGSGKLKIAIHRYLTSLGDIVHFKSDSANPGVTWVYL
jgi:DNA mismatch repair protein MutS2